MSVVTPSVREMFTRRELVAAYKEFKEHGPQYQDAETGLSASAYRFGERVLLVYEESETGLVVLIHPTSWNRNSRKFISKILYSPAPIPRNAPPPGAPHSPAPLELVTPMDRYARLRILS